MPLSLSEKALLILLKKYVNNPKDGNLAFKIGDLFLCGKGFAKNSKKALYYYTIAAENGHTYAMHMVGWSYILGWHNKPNNKKAYYWFKKGTMLDDFACSVDYGICLLHGVGCKKDIRQAAKYFSTGALNGHGVSQYCLGSCYLEKDFKLDYAKAFYWIKKAADQNHFEALNKLGQLYEKGIGVDKNTTIAKLYYIKAAKAGSKDAKNKLKHWR